MKLDRTMVVNPRFQLGLLVALSVIFSAISWLKLGSFWGDAPRSLFEMYRASIGEVPYRDFSWPYPPLPVAVFALLLKCFGASFTVAQLGLDALSLGCVIGVWCLARRLAPAVPALAAAVAFTFIGATNGGNFALFSLKLYTPSILAGTLGLVLFCIGLIDYIQAGLGTRVAALLIFGGFIGCLSRPECVAAMLFALLVLAGTELWWHRTQAITLVRGLAKIAFVVFAPSFLVYLGIIAWIGFRPVFRGITAYGMASIACPWWPTGFGLTGAVAALGGFVAALGVLDWYVAGRPRKLFLIAISAGGWLLYSTVFFRDLSLSQSTRQGVWAIPYFLVSANTILLPVMWIADVMFVVEAVDFFRGKVVDTFKDRQRQLIILGIIFVISARALFNNANSHASTVTPALYPILIPFLPLLVQSVYERWSAVKQGLPPAVGQRLNWGVVAALCVYSLIRLCGYGFQELRNPYVTVQTQAGPVKLSDGNASQNAYEFLLANTASGEDVADIAYGGGLNFALHRRSPLYSTQFTNFRPTPDQRERDYSQLRAAKTRIVISREPPVAEYGSAYGCAFPKFVWKATACRDTAVVFPVLTFVTERYRPKMRFGGISAYLLEHDTGAVEQPTASQSVHPGLNFPDRVH